MARLPRFELAGIPQHVVQRGNNRLSCFLDDEDRQRYLQCLRQTLLRFGCKLHAYVLMSNHVHLLLTPVEAGAVSRMMHTFAPTKPGRRKLNAFGLVFVSPRPPWPSHVHRAAQGLFRHGLKAFAPKGALLLQMLANGDQRTETGTEEVKCFWACFRLASVAPAVARSPGGPRSFPPWPESVCSQRRAPAADACEWRSARLCSRLARATFDTLQHAPVVSSPSR